MCQSIIFVLDLVPQLRIVESHNGPFCHVRDWAISDVEMLAASHCLRDPNDLMVLWSKTYSLQLPQSVHRNSIWQDGKQIIRYSGRVYQIQVFNCHGLSRVQGLQCWDAQKGVGVWRVEFLDVPRRLQGNIPGVWTFCKSKDLTTSWNCVFCVYAIGFLSIFFASLNFVGIHET